MATDSMKTAERGMTACTSRMSSILANVQISQPDCQSRARKSVVANTIRRVCQISAFPGSGVGVITAPRCLADAPLHELPLPESEQPSGELPDSGRAPDATRAEQEQFPKRQQRLYAGWRPIRRLLRRRLLHFHRRVLPAAEHYRHGNRTGARDAHRPGNGVQCRVRLSERLLSARCAVRRHMRLVAFDLQQLSPDSVADPERRRNGGPHGEHGGFRAWRMEAPHATDLRVATDVQGPRHHSVFP